MRIVFWQNIPSFHQSAMIRTLASNPGIVVTIAIQDDLSQKFKEGGWLIPDFGKAKLIHPQNNDDIHRIFLEAGSDAVHIFSGIRFTLVRKAFLHAVSSKNRIGLLVEASDWRGLKGFARLLLCKFEFLRYQSRIDFVLAMGHLGVRWYLRCGFNADKIYPFAYVVEKQTSATFLPPSNSTCRLVFVGQCIRRKGLDLLLSALAAHRGLNWHLDIVGDGPERDNLIRQASNSELIGKITFHGALQNQTARQLISQSDCLILPSRWDGWGAVVNEALMMGVPVICSDLCGASDLLGTPERGETFKAGSVVSLCSVLERWILKGNKTQESVDRVKSWAESIEGKAVGDYLFNVIDSVAGVKERPHVPWRNEEQSCV